MISPKKSTPKQKEYLVQTTFHPSLKLDFLMSFRHIFLHSYLPGHTTLLRLEFKGLCFIEDVVFSKMGKEVIEQERKHALSNDEFSDKV